MMAPQPITRTGAVLLLVEDNPEDEKQFMRAFHSSRTDGYIRKPVESTQFLEAVRHAGLFSVLVKQAS